MKKIAVAAVSGILLSLGVATLSTAPAYAAESYCASGVTCLFKDTGYSTNGDGNNLVSFGYGARNFSLYSWANGAGTIWKAVSSAFNNGNSQTSYLFYNTNFNSEAAHFPIKTGLLDLGPANDGAASGGFAYCLSNPSSSLCS